MAKSVRTGSTGNRMSSIVSGDKPARGQGSYRANSTVRAESYLNNPVVSPVSRLKDYVGPPSKVGLEKPKNIPRSYVPSRIKQIFDPTPFATPVVAKKPVAKKPVAKPAPQVVSNVTNAKMSPVKNSSVSSRMAVNPRTGDTTGFTTGKTTGSSVSKSGVATKTYQSAYDRQRANAERRFGVAGPTGGGSSSSRSSTSGNSRSTSSGGNLGGAAGRGEPRGSKK